MKKTYFISRFLIFLLLLSLGKSAVSQTFGCTGDLYVEIEDVSDDPAFLDLDFVVYSFDDIASIQFSVEFDPAILAVEQPTYVHESMDGNLLFNLNYTGAVPLAWTSPTASTISLPDNETMFTLRFRRIGNGESQVIIGDNPTMREAVTIEGIEVKEVCFNVQGQDFESQLAVLSGIVARGEDDSCFYTEAYPGLPYWKLRVYNDVDEKIITTKRDGSYKTLLEPGDYNMEVVDPNDLWNSCDNTPGFTLADINSTYNFDFVVNPVVDCHNLNVDISAPFLRRCFPNSYTLEYSNTGTTIAEDAYIEVELDPFFILESASEDYTISDGKLRFDIGDVDIFESGKIAIRGTISCDSELGQTHCTEAIIYPTSNCIQPNYMGAIIEVEGECVDNEVVFRVTNIGESITTSKLDIIIAEDDVMRSREDIDLEPDESKEYTVLANGSTYRIIAEQEEGYPFPSMPSVAIEGCGQNENGEISTGFVTMFSEDDGAANISIDCQENRGSYDPNDKQASPKGYGASHSIYAFDELEYRIRFQNTGTDTAFKVVVIDTISEHLDMATFEIGSTSHPMEYAIDGSVVRFEFSPIALVDSTTNEPGSHGYIQYKINQKQDNPIGTIIENYADIYFDFNDPIRTNTTFHMVDEDFLKSLTSSNKNLQLEDVKVFPNPAVRGDVITINREKSSDLKIELYEITGKQLHTIELQNGKSHFTQNMLGEGTYIMKMMDKDAIISIQKLIVTTKN